MQTQVHQESKETAGEKLLEAEEIDQNLNSEVIECLATAPGQVEAHNLPEPNEQSLSVLNNASCKHLFYHHEHSYARSSCEEDSTIQSKSAETSFNEPEVKCDEDENRLVIDETTVANAETDDQNETFLMEVNETQSPKEKLADVEESLPKDIAANVVEESPSESRLTKRVRNELNRLLSSSRELEDVSTSRRSCFLRQVEVGYKDIDSNRRNLPQDKKRTETNVSTSETTKQEDQVRQCSVYLCRLNPESIDMKNVCLISSLSVPLKQNVTARKSTSSKTFDAPAAKKPRLDTKDGRSREQNPFDDDSDGDSEGFKGWEQTQNEDKNDETTIIPYQCVIPAPPVNDFQLWIYKSICNIAFAKSRRGFIYKCLIHGCRHQTLVKEALLTHLKDKHSNQEWNGFCNICEKVVSLVNKEGRGNGRALAGKRILEEFEHMDAHIISLEKAKFPVRREDSITNRALICEPSKPKPKSTASSKQSPATSMKDCIKKLKLSASISIKSVPSSSLSLNPTTKPAKSLVTNVKKKVVPKRAATATASQQDPPSELHEMEKQQKVKKPKLLRPWLKSGTINTKTNELAEIMQSEEGLSATYKCMSSTCSFYTIDSKLFIMHLEYHDKFTASDKANYLMCAYCEFSGNSVGHLMEHFNSDHVYDCYQCKYCFYRSSTDFIVITHQNIIHKRKPNAIIECPAILKRQDSPAELELLKKHQKQNVPPIVCVFCRGIFFAMKTFTDHLANHKGNLNARCIKCGEITSKKTLHSHLEKCRGIGLYQCVYCELGTNNFELLSNHIANVHPSLKPVFCERIDNRNADGTLKNVRRSRQLFVFT